MLLRINRHSQEIIDKVLELYSLGKSIETIRKELNVGKNFVHKTLKQFNTEDRIARKRKVKMEFEQPICIKYVEGLSPREIAKEFNCTTTTVRKIVKRNGIEINTRGGQHKNISDDLKMLVIQKYKEGASQEELAKLIGYANNSPISYLLNLWGIEKRALYPKGEKHGSWKGGRYTNNSGYVNTRLKLPEENMFANMTSATGYILEHRLVMAKHFGRPLESYETVHHIDGNRQNNNLSNLQLMFSQPKGASLCCRKCGSFDLKAMPLGTTVEETI